MTHIVAVPASLSSYLEAKTIYEIDGVRGNYRKTTDYAVDSYTARGNTSSRTGSTVGATVNGTFRHYWQTTAVNGTGSATSSSSTSVTCETRVVTTTTASQVTRTALVPTSFSEQTRTRSAGSSTITETSGRPTPISFSTSSVTSLVTTTVTTSAYTSVPHITNTLFDASEWAWRITNTGVGRLSDVGSSLTFWQGTEETSTLITNSSQTSSSSSTREWASTQTSTTFQSTYLSTSTSTGTVSSSSVSTATSQSSYSNTYTAAAETVTGSTQLTNTVVTESTSTGTQTGGVVRTASNYIPGSAYTGVTWTVTGGASATVTRAVTQASLFTGSNSDAIGWDGVMPQTTGSSVLSNFFDPKWESTDTDWLPTNYPSTFNYSLSQFFTFIQATRTCWQYNVGGSYVRSTEDVNKAGSISAVYICVSLGSTFVSTVVESLASSATRVESIQLADGVVASITYVNEYWASHATRAKRWTETTMATATSTMSSGGDVGGSTITFTYSTTSVFTTASVWQTTGYSVSTNSSLVTRNTASTLSYSIAVPVHQGTGAITVSESLSGATNGISRTDFGSSFSSTSYVFSSFDRTTTSTVSSYPTYSGTTTSAGTTRSTATVSLYWTYSTMDVFLYRRLPTLSVRPYVATPEFISANVDSVGWRDPLNFAIGDPILSRVNLPVPFGYVASADEQSVYYIPKGTFEFGGITFSWVPSSSKFAATTPSGTTTYSFVLGPAHTESSPRFLPVQQNIFFGGVAAKSEFVVKAEFRAGNSVIRFPIDPHPFVGPIRNSTMSVGPGGYLPVTVNGVASTLTTTASKITFAGGTLTNTDATAWAPCWPFEWGRDTNLELFVRVETATSSAATHIDFVSLSGPAAIGIVTVKHPM